MIRSIDINDIDEVNKILKEFEVSISKSSIEDSFFKCFVYEDKVIKGVVIFKEIYERIELEYIVVDKKFRRSKIATSLMEYLINYAQDSNIENITLEVNVNNIKAISLYKKFDFKTVSIRKNYYESDDAYLMMKVIG